ncbi:MAG: hypothetical protein GWN71_44615, partial [Gammaproteobacteria bacterium]|nr:hypothetical protein [Gemmatimonadota bacterium]NIU80373.1 hypothetical protein [Gammaproteobacteria bacterium]NIW77833.1 hypothetical protein [Gemmatimonadota bacterium]
MARGTGEAGSRPAWASSLGVAALGLVFGGVLAFVVGALDAVVVISVALAAAGLVVMIVRPEIAVHVVLFAVYTNVTVVAATT